MKATIHLSAIFILFYMPLRAQVAGNAVYDANKHSNPPIYPRSILMPVMADGKMIVSVNGLANVKPDAFVATFGVIQLGETAEVTDQLMQNRIEQFRSSLSESGLLGIEVHVDMISFVPKYELETEQRLFSKTYNEIPAGYQIQKNVVVVYRRAADLDKIVSLAAKAEIYDLAKVDYSSKNIESVKDSLRRQCMNELKRRIDSYAFLRPGLDTLTKVIGENFAVSDPPTRYASYQAAARASLKNVQKQTGNLNEMPIASSKYYQPYAPGQFDVVSNPLVTEPVIQVMYQVDVHYYIQNDKSYHLITPAGEIRKITGN